MTAVKALSARLRSASSFFMLESALLALLCTPMFATIDVKDYGAQGDGLANDTASLNNAFAVACKTSEDIYIPSGTYIISSLNALHGCGVTFYGDGSDKTVLKLTAADRQSMWTFVGTPRQTLALALQDLALDGGHLGGAGISIEQYQAVTINRVSVHDFGIPGYSLGHNKDFDGLYIRDVENVHITDSQFTGNERYGVELQAVHSSIVRSSAMSLNGRMGGVSEQNFEGPLDGPLVAQWLDNTLMGNGGGGIDVETDPRLPPAQGILEGNQIDSCGNDMWDASWALVLGLHSFGIIGGNWVHNFAANTSRRDYTDAIVYGQNAGPISIVNNTVIGTKSRAIAGSDGRSPVAIVGNTLTENGTGIFIYNSPGVRISKNKITGSLGFGIVVSLSHGTVLSGNQLVGNSKTLKFDEHTAKHSSTERPNSSLGLECVTSWCQGLTSGAWQPGAASNTRAPCCSLSSAYARVVASEQLLAVH